MEFSRRAELQLLMKSWIESKEGEFAQCLTRENEGRGIQISAESMLTVDEVAMRMATAAYDVFQAMAAATDRHA